MSVAARAVFAVLVAATFGAFFVAQNLKSSAPVVEVRGIARHFSPNGDGRRDTNDFSVVLTGENDDVTVGIVDAEGDEIRRLASGVAARAFRPLRLSWDGRADNRVRAPDGRYRVRIALRRKGRSVVVPTPLALDTTPPRPRVELAKRQTHVIGPVARPVEARVFGAGRAARSFQVWRTDVEPFKQVAAFDGDRRSRRATWDGRADGKPAPPGVYLIEAVVQDIAGNRGSSAPGLPERPREVFGNAGVTVRTIGVAPPVRPAVANEFVTFFVDARGKPYSYQMRRLGESRPRRRGRSTRAKLVIRAPGGKSGVYLLQVRARRFATEVPFLVQSPKRAKVLVVTPAITWFGRAQVDDNGDGLPDTLDTGGPVATSRALAGLPAGFADEVAPLLVFLDRARVTYDVTTDVALARSRDPRATDRAGVLLPGPLRWVPRPLARRLRRYVQDGGRLAAFGTESLRRGVAVRGGDLPRLVGPTQPTPDDPFGARLADPRKVDAKTELTPIGDTRADDAVLTAWSGVLTGFALLEESQTPVGEAPKPHVGIGQAVSEEEIVAAEAAGKLPREALPAFTSTPLGKGLVIRVGLPEWARRLSDPNVSQLTRNIIDLLRRVNPKPRSPVR